MTQSTGKRNRTQAVHTLETLAAKTEEIGSCAEWQGCMQNGVPHVFHKGKMVAVRWLMLELEGIEVPARSHIGCRHRNKACVERSHIVVRTPTEHAVLMSTSPARQETLRAAKLAGIARTTRAKITMDDARAIRGSDEPGPVLAERYGIHRGMVNRIKRGDAWREFSNPFAGLLRMAA